MYWYIGTYLLCIFSLSKARGGRTLCIPLGGKGVLNLYPKPSTKAEGFFIFFSFPPTPVNTPSQVLNSAPAEPKVVIIDNYDSFTFNIREALAKLGVDAQVIRNDELQPREFETLNPSHIIIGPGPGTPDCPEDVGISFHAIDYALKNHRSLLGICLGHQAIAKHFGGLVEHAPDIKHGKTSMLSLHRSDLEDNSYDLFKGINHDLEVMRYHSLVANLHPPGQPQNSLSETSAVYDEHGYTLMSLQHRTLPIFGVQFHPESFATPDGQTILDNFLQTNPAAYAELKRRGIPEVQINSQDVPLPGAIQDILADLPRNSFSPQEFPCALPPEEVFTRLHAHSDHMYGLESLETHPGDTVGRYSYFGFHPSFVISARDRQLFLDEKEVENSGSSPMNVFQAMTKKLTATPSENIDVPPDQRLTGGFVGYMAYEAAQYREPQAISYLQTPADQKTFSFGYFPDGLTYDRQRKTYTYYTRGEDRSALFQEALRSSGEEQEPCITPIKDPDPTDFEKRVQTIRDTKIREGETFQTVLSHKNVYSITGSMAPLYRRLREICPSQNMHAIKMGHSESIGSFPELTLSIHNGEAVTYQVAGTIARTGSFPRDTEAFARLLSDPKERAEHMMLVDLARNDLSRHSIPGSIYLPEGFLMHRLDAGSVMHIASEVRSRISSNVSPLEVLLDVTPMGTVSGAPKIRSMQIIHEQERGEPRGLYAGSFGFVDARGGIEMVVGLRSLMRQRDIMTIQAGAGIVYDSIPSKEQLETLMKKQVPLKTAHPFLANISSAGSDSEAGTG